MVAALVPATTLPLLLEPDWPPKDQLGRVPGFRSSTAGRVRHHADDAYGALVQHAIVRYYVHGVEREQIANEVGYSPRQVQSWLAGTHADLYAAPVRRTLGTLGISLRRGGRTAEQPRLREVIAAYATLLGQAAGRLDVMVHGDLVATIHVVLAGREPLDGGRP